MKRFVTLIACLVVALLLALAWRSRTTLPGPAADHPRVPAGARTVDLSLFSPALSRTMRYRVVEPSEMTFVDDLRKRGFKVKFHEADGGPGWQQWNAQLPAVILALQSEIRTARLR